MVDVFINSILTVMHVPSLSHRAYRMLRRVAIRVLSQAPRRVRHKHPIDERRLYRRVPKAEHSRRHDTDSGPSCYLKPIAAVADILAGQLVRTFMLSNVLLRL